MTGTDIHQSVLAPNGFTWTCHANSRRNAGCGVHSAVPTSDGGNGVENRRYKTRSVAAMSG